MQSKHVSNSDGFNLISGTNQHLRVRGPKYLRYKIDLNSPRTQQAFLNLGLTMEDVQQKQKQQVYDRTLSQEANDLKFDNYVQRVNDASKKINLERRRIAQKHPANALSIEQVFEDKRPYTSLNNPNSRTRGLGSFGSVQQLRRNQLQSFITQPQQEAQNEVTQYQRDLLSQHNRNQMWKEQNELKKFLWKEKEMTKSTKTYERRMRKVEEHAKQQIEEQREALKVKEQKRLQRIENKKRQDKEFQRSLDKANLDATNKLFERSAMTSQLRKSSSQMALTQKFEESKRKRLLQEQEINKKIEQDNQRLLEKQMRSTLNHELILEDKRATLRDRNQIINDKKNWVDCQEIVYDLVSENKYLTKTEAINKRRMELAEKMQERSEKLNKLHELKKGKRGQHLKDIKDQIKAIEQKVLERQSQFSVLNADINGSINKAAQERRYLMTSGSTRDLVRERNLIKRDIIQENLEREKRKLEWKKLNVMAKDRIVEERLGLQKECQRQLISTQNEMRIRKTRERDRVIKTIQQVRTAPFSPYAKRLIGLALPEGDSKELEDIYRDSSEERKKKKEEEEKDNY